MSWGGREEYLPVATTRPETLLGDSAVAVHPEVGHINCVASPPPVAYKLRGSVEGRRRIEGVAHLILLPNSIK